ncbi:tripartite tricarboxylate transporter substrate binding protein [Phreatobacter aquaticus]|uniref:Tripartite tricarboxylate transporter substrate binding protein n=1 Tax=Phreatobacter aquaticus TaxID=2570229 RepID=A0A4D7QJG3_9HYPH|nr:tripartite tricarboxylate transporter substrate binding protein [Phreatobacter aquaticus]QCK86781.1 tripartite tricarboxylate transporter substrate binding protein [Phreatobacter aquaticus]
MKTVLSRRSALALAGGALATPFVGSEGFAQAYPARPVTVIVPFGAGGSTDVIGRIVSERLSVKLGQSFVIENRAGAGGNVGVAALARSTNDGYTIGMTTIANHGINPNLYGERLPFKPLDDFEFLSLSSSQPNFMCIHPSIPAQNLQEFIAYLKANPGKENFGSSGIGTSIHLSAELFMQLTGTRLTHVPMRSSAALVQALIGGEVKLSFDNFTSPYPHYKAGTIRGLAVTSLKPAKIAPEVPALANTLPGFDITSWNGFAAPKGTPKEICDRLTTAMRELLAEPAVVARFEEMGAESTPSSPDEMRQKSVSEMAKFKDIIQKADIKLQN